MEGLENRTLGKYRILHQIGRGTTGTIYLADDPVAERKVAIKVANPASLGQGRSGQRRRKLMLNEATAARMLDHPNIVALYDAGVAEDLSHIVMEYVPGGKTLQDYCRPERLLPLQEVLRLAVSVASALDYAHRKGVVHRDIKPRNILLTETGEAKISDFGIALITSEDAEETQVLGYLGSPLYMSPEQLSGGNSITHHTDIFSLGAVLYELLTGTQAFGAGSIAEITYRINREPQLPMRQLRANLPPALEQIIDRALKKHPAGRYNTAMDLAGDLNLVLDQIEAAAEHVSERAKRFNAARMLSFFSEFGDNELFELIDIGDWLHWDADADIISGDGGDALYVLVAGEVVAHRGGLELDLLARGSCFGKSDSGAETVNTCSFTAKNAATALQIPLAQLNQTSDACQLALHRACLKSTNERLARAMDFIAKTLARASLRKNWYDLWER